MHKILVSLGVLVVAGLIGYTTTSTVLSNRSQTADVTGSVGYYGQYRTASSGKETVDQYTNRISDGTMKTLPPGCPECSKQEEAVKKAREVKSQAALDFADQFSADGKVSSNLLNKFNQAKQNLQKAIGELTNCKERQKAYCDGYKEANTDQDPIRIQNYKKGAIEITPARPSSSSPSYKPVPSR